MAFFTSDWNPLGRNIFYRKSELYTMRWSDQIQLSDYVVTAAPWGGPIAIIRDEKKLLKVNLSGKPIIYIFSASGLSISTIKWNSGKLMHLAWSQTEDLLCIQDDGVVLVYDLFGAHQRNFSMGQEAKDSKVLECKVFHGYHGTGIAVLTGSYTFFLMNNIKEPHLKQLTEVPGLERPPSSWIVFTEEKAVKVLLAQDTKLSVLDNEVHALKVEFSQAVKSIIEMCISPNQQNLALFCDTGAIWIGTTTFKRKFCEFETGCPTRPQQFLWCGNQAVLSYWDNLLLVIGPEKDFINYSLDSAVHLVSEMDGTRIISTRSHELLQKVPGVVTEIFRIGSVAPGALLLEASKEHQKKSHKAEDYMSMIRASDQLEVAVQQCIQAAGYEWLPNVQKMLLRAAAFGKNFGPWMDPNLFVQMCQKLRVLNAVRVDPIGLPITYAQLHQLTLPVLLDRLVLRRHYDLAIRISKYMKIPDTEGASRILAHWACYKVKQEEWDGEKAASEIAQKLGETPGVSYSEIAHKAVEYGKMQLAIRLLDYEPRASQQVPLLIKLKQETAAMTKAIESGDDDLIYMVIMFLKGALPFADFLRTLNQFPVAYTFYLKLCKEHSLEKLRDAYYQEDNQCAQADCFVMESYQTAIPERRIATLKTASESYRKGKNEFLVQQTDEQVRLLKCQMKLKEKLNQPSYGAGLSVTQTLRKLLLDKEYKFAEDFHKEFKIPERRYWWVKLMSLAEAQDWLEVERFSKSKKSPIGYEPFVDVCIKYGNKFEAQKYLPKVKEESKVKYYTKAGLFEEAAKIAFDQRDEAGLNLVQAKCTNRVLNEKISSMKAQLTRRS